MAESFTPSFNAMRASSSVLAAFFSSTVAGGDFSTKVKDLSAKAVITTGSFRPGS